MTVTAWMSTVMIRPTGYAEDMSLGKTLLNGAQAVGRPHAVKKRTRSLTGFGATMHGN